jgi:pSer/pThr/pTyr-binding forkhead associated (FHA) protein
LRQVNVLAWHEQSTTRHATALFSPLDAPPPPEQTALRNPQLIVQGTQFVPLDRPIITIGRRRDNHIVIDSATVSRAHAQLRLRFGKYVIYDLGSTAGTFVNEQRISECILNPGDVISIGNVLIVYVEDDGTTSSQAMDMNDTQSMDMDEGE